VTIEFSEFNRFEEKSICADGETLGAIAGIDEGTEGDNGQMNGS
jgi:hypothetical protein